MNFYGRVLQESYVPDNMARARVRRLYEVDQGERPSCEACGQWYVGRVRHECDPSAPLQVSYKLTKDNWNRAEAVRDRLGLSFDSGAGGGVRDWQFEMLSAKDRHAVAEALASARVPHNLRFQGGRVVAASGGEKLAESDLHTRIVLTEGKKLSKTEQRIMNELEKKGVFKHSSGSVRRGVARYTKSYPYGGHVETAIRKLEKRGLVDVKAEHWQSQGEAEHSYIVTKKSP
jgi:hypothetical protein